MKSNKKIIIAIGVVVVIAIVILAIILGKDKPENKEVTKATEMATEVATVEPEATEITETEEPTDVVVNETPTTVPVVTDVPQSTNNTTNSKKQEFLTKVADIEQYNDSLPWDTYAQADMNVASAEVYEKWDALLNEVYQYLKDTMPEAEFEKLKQDEIDWINKKDADLASVEVEYAGGSILPLVYNQTASEYTADRCKYLISLIEE